MTSSRVRPVAGGRNSCIFSFCDLMNGSFRTAGQQQSCRAGPLLTAEGPRRTTNCLHTAGKQEEINQAKRRFSLRNRPSSYACRLVTSKHDDNSLLAEMRKKKIKKITRVVFSHLELAGPAGLWHATCLTTAREAAVRCSGVVKGTLWSRFAVFFPVSQPQAYEKQILRQLSLPRRTGGCTASSKRCKKPHSRGTTKEINKITWGQTQGQQQPR